MTHDELVALLDETAEVEAGGVTWKVGDPTNAEALDVVRKFLAYRDAEGAGDQTEALGDAYTAAIAACVRIDGLERLTPELAGRVLRRSRGLDHTKNALVVACMLRCGVELAGPGEDPEADPT